jgi:phosphomannomutase
MVQHGALLGGESSGGLTIRGHILGKDGIFAAGLVVEMLARTGQTISQLLHHIYEVTGRLYAVEQSIPATSEMRVAVPRRLRDAALDHLGDRAVVRTSHIDGTKLFLENDNWALLRFSGTEPVLRLFAEADTVEAARELIGHLKQHVGMGSSKEAP